MFDSTRDFFDSVSKVLLRCWLFGLALLLMAFVVILLAGGIIDDIHGRIFGLSPHEVDLVFYCWLGTVKLLVLVLFLMPWLAIKMVLRKEKAA